MKNRTKVEAPAKINLTLDVKGKRPDGYHEIETVMYHINLVDKIYIKKADKGIKISSDSDLIPDDEENIAYKAAKLIMEKNGQKEGLEIFIEKNIPVGAGLAGGSTDAAAVLRGINSLFNLGLAEAGLLELAAEIGSDVPFCLLHSTALAQGRGELLTPLSTTVDLDIVLVKPPFQLSTALVYGELDLDKVESFPDIGAFLAAWNNADLIQIADNLNNVLESVSIRKHPEIAIIKEDLIKLGALNALMSGSGPSVLGVFKDKEAAYQAFQVEKKRYQEVFLVSSYKRGD